MKLLKCIFVCSVLLIAEYGIGQSPTNHYATLFWLQDNLCGDSLTLNEIGLSSSRKSDIADRLLISSLDSNASSRILYQNGSNLNQHLFAGLSRPISKSVFFFFDLKRYSYAGWMDRSFYRSTQVNSLLSMGVSDRFDLGFAASFINEDRELNGGLKSSSYSEGETVGGAFESIYTDINLSEAFQRTSDLQVSLDGNYNLLDNGGASLFLNGSVGAEQERYTFGDDDELGGEFYDRYAAKVVDIINDTSRINTLRESLGLRFFSEDSLKGIEAGLNYSFLQHKVLNNGRVFQAWNNVVSGMVSGNYRAWFADVDMKRYLSGYNGGDFRNSLKTGLRGTRSSDSANNSYWEAALRLVRSAAYPTLQYFDYRSQVLDVSNVKQQSEELLIELNFGYQTDHWSFGLTPGRRRIDDYQFWDSAASLSVSPNTLGFQYLKIFVGFTTEHMNVSVKQWFQETSDDIVYSIPSYTATGELSTMWPLFKNRLEVKLGVTGHYFSSYYARGYIPHLAVYYSQSGREYGEYLQLNFHSEVVIRNTVVFFGVQNCNHGLFLSPVLVGPNFPSVPRFLVFGVDWMFKN